MDLAKVEPGVTDGYCGLIHPPPFYLLLLWLTDLPSVLKIPGEQGRRDGDETASLTVSHCNPSLHCLPASICLQLAPPPTPQDPSCPPNTHTQTRTPSLHPFFHPRLQVWALKQCSYQSLSQRFCIRHTHTSFFFPFITPLSISLSSLPLLSFPPPSPLSSASFLTLRPNLFHLISLPQWPCAN